MGGPAMPKIPIYSPIQVAVSSLLGGPSDVFSYPLLLPSRGFSCWSSWASSILA